jgi:hypothetical protein
MTERPGATGAAGADRVTDTLTALRSDVDSLPLAESGSVRRRGELRTRHQVVGSTLVVAALVAGAIGVGAGLTGGSDKVIAPVTEGPSQSAEQTVDLAADPFLQVEDLTGFGGYDQAGPFVDSGQEPDVRPEQCATRPGGWGATQVRSTRFYQDGSEVELREYVLRFDDAASAEQAALKRAYSDLAATCPATVDPSDGTLTTRDSELVPGLDGAVRSSRYFVPELASEPNYYEVATAHQGNVLVVLEWQASGNPSGDGAQDWAWDADRLQTALDRAFG